MVVHDHGKCPVVWSVEEGMVLRRDRRSAALAALLGAVIVTGVAAIAVPAGSSCVIGCSARAATPAASSGPSPQPSEKPDGDAENTKWAYEMVWSLDSLRVRAGCRPLVENKALQHAARAHAESLAARGGVSHVDHIGGTAQDRAGRQGYPGNVIELVAKGVLNPDELGASVTQLANQTDLLDCRFRSVGAGGVNRHLVIVLGDR